MARYQALLVDDEPLAISGLMKGVHWQDLGIETVHTANSMIQALDVLDRFPVHVMISDIEMPGGSGLDLIREANTRFPDLICLFYTAYPDFSYCQEALKLGAADYLVKPVPYDEMEQILARVLGQVERNRRTKDLEGIWGNLTKQTEKDDPIAVVKRMIEENLSHEITRDELAAAVYLNPDYLTRRFKQETGVSLSDYIIDKRLSLAKHLLLHTDLSIVEISEKAGFSYSTYFVRLFKKKLGITPQQYREQSSKE